MFRYLAAVLLAIAIVFGVAIQSEAGIFRGGKRVVGAAVRGAAKIGSLPFKAVGGLFGGACHGGSCRGR